MLSIWTSWKKNVFRKEITLISYDKSLDQSKLKEFADDKIIVTQK